MSIQPANAYIIGLFVAKSASTHEDGTWTFEGVANTLNASGEFPAAFKFTICIGVSGYGQHTFSYEVLSHDGGQLMEFPEEDIDLAEGMAFWAAHPADITVPGPYGIEIIAYLNGEVAAVFPVRIE